MTAYKFLATGGLGPLSGVAWPLPVGDTPGAWLEADGPLAVCRRGAHVCRPIDLAHWLSDELWAVETAGDQLAGIDCLVVERARLVRRFTAWSDGGAARFAGAALAHAAALAGPAASGDVRGLIDDGAEAASEGYPAVAAYCAALAVARLGADAPARAYAVERAWQSAWIAREILAT
jgi:hypothetical protein